MNENSAENKTIQLECPSTAEPSIRCFIFAAVVIGFAIWCFTDRRPPPEAWDFKHINEVFAYLLNNWGPVVFVPIGIITLAIGIKQLKSKLIADDEGFTYTSKSKIRWDQIKKLDSSVLKAKGILYLTIEDGNEIKLDSWKLQNFRELVKLIEQKVSTGPAQKQAEE